jgi:pilus assembly protein CpaC
LLVGGLVCGQDAPQPILNPFTIKVRPATVRPLTDATAADPQPAAIGSLRPAVIRPVVVEAVENPHVTAPTRAEAQPKSARPLRPAPLSILNETVRPRTLTSPADDEHLAPVVSSAEMKKRRAQLFAPKQAAPSPSPADERATDRPISPWIKDIRRAQKAAATEEIADPAPAPAAPEAPADEESLAGTDRSSEGGAETPVENEPDTAAPQPLAPVLRVEDRAQAGDPAPARPQAPERAEQQLPRALLVDNQTQPAPRRAAPEPAPAGPAVPEGSPFEVIKPSDKPLQVQVRRSLLLRTQKDVYRTATVDEAICEIVQFTPRELSIIGRSQGSTHVTFWFDDPNMQPVTYLVEVRPDAAEIKKEEEKYLLLEDVLNEMFPDSKIKLSLVADKLIVRGQAKDSEEAFQIMTIIRAQAGYRAGWPGGYPGAGINEGQAAQVLADTATGSTRRTNYQVVNMLRVPGVQQVALRVKIAELNRTAARNFGIDIKGTIDINDSSKILLNSLSSVATGEAPPILFNVDGDDISIGLNALQRHGVVKLLSEPTLVTMSGRPATFLAGGEFAVPTVVGSAGLNAVTTDFRAFGAIISFLPTVVDKDRIRLEVAPEFSEINTDLATGGTSTGSIPSLNVRAATTTVEMREGQTLAIAGLLQDSMTANNAGDLPFLQRIIGRRTVTRNENELIILVTPELVHPMEPEEVPPLPGFDVTEPTNTQFYLHGDLEGNPTMDYRSTVWPRLKKRYKAGGPAMTSGPFGHGQ